MENTRTCPENWKSTEQITIENEINNTENVIKSLMEFRETLSRDKTIKKNDKLINQNRNKLAQQKDKLNQITALRKEQWNSYCKRNKKLELLYYYKPDNVPIPYEKFSKAGIDKHQYIHYLWLFERLRNSSIFYEESFGFFSKVKRQENGATLKETTLKILDTFVEDIMEYVENIIGYRYYRKINFRAYMQMNIYNNIYLDHTLANLEPHLKSYIDVGGFKYTNEVDFRALFENLIKLTILGKKIEVIYRNDVEYDDLIKDDQAYYVNTHNIDDILSCLNTPTEKNEYYKRICDEIEVLEKKSISIVAPIGEPENPDDPKFSVWVKQMKAYLEEEKENEEELSALYEIKNRLSDTVEVNLAEVEDEVNLIDDNEHVIWVFRGQIGCYKNKHCIKSVKAFVKDLNNKTVIVYVDYCVDCQKFYIDEEYLLRVQNKYGVILLRLKPHESLGQYYDAYKRNPESSLKLYGYTVKQGELSETDRRKLLAALIDNSLLSFGEITSYLMLFIKTNGSSYNNRFAKEKWQKDLDFVRQYNADGTIRGELKQL